MRRVPILLTVTTLALLSLTPATTHATTTPGYHTVLQVTRKAKAWTSRPVHLQHRVLFKAQTDCTAFPNKRPRFFRADLIGSRGQIRQIIDLRGVRGSTGTGGATVTIPPGRYHLRITTSCTFTAWHITLSTR